MQFNRRLVLMLAIMLAAFVAFALTVGAADNDPVTVTGILKAAGSPLTAEQQDAIKAINPDEGTRGVRTVTQTFTDEQNAALIAVLGEMVMPAGMGNFGGGQAPGGAAAGAAGGPGGGRGMMGPRINYLTQVIILEKEGVPLTEKQLADAKTAAEAAAAEAAQGGQGGGMGFGRMGMGALNDILTEKQTAAYEKYTANMGNFGGGAGGFGGGSFGGN